MTSNLSGPSIPEITVQIVHIEGPRKGQIDELSVPRITIGRDPSSEVVYGKDLRMVSRRHAEIVREGNRFLLKNLSPNGCLVNGQPAQEAYLKQGDVIAFAEGGPKVSFLYTVQAAARPRPQTPAPRPGPLSTPAPATRATSIPGAGRESAPFTIQFGTSIKSYKQAAVTLGRDAGNHFVVGHPRVLPMHAELLFQNGQYYLRDTSGCQATLLNSRPIYADTPLQDNDIVTLGDAGPQLRFLGQGRFAEVLEQPLTPPPSAPAPPTEPPQMQKSREPSVKDVLKSFFKK